MLVLNVAQMIVTLSTGSAVEEVNSPKVKCEKVLLNFILYQVRYPQSVMRSKCQSRYLIVQFHCFLPCSRLCNIACRVTGHYPHAQRPQRNNWIEITFFSSFPKQS